VGAYDIARALGKARRTGRSWIMANPLPPAPPWDWRDKVVCCICAPHYRILRSSDWKFLWRFERRKLHDGLEARHAQRLDLIVEQLDRYAQGSGIVWP
jgi:hypothetical protein